MSWGGFMCEEDELTYRNPRRPRNWGAAATDTEDADEE